MNKRLSNQISKYSNFIGVIGLASLTGVTMMTTSANAGTTFLDDVSVSIPLSCTMSGAETEAHSVNILGGQYKKDIGSTTLTAYCNDPGGFSIYAIGYTDNILGNNTMVADNGAPAINAGIATTGDTSSWGMKVTPVAGTYAMTLGTGLTTNSDGYYAIPSDFTKVAYLNTATGLEGVASSNLTTTYFIYAAGTQPAGSYKGQVAYTLVHPYTKDAVTLEQAFANAGKSKVTVDGQEYYTMQDMTPAICADASVYGELSQVQLVDIRDNKLYWATKLEDDHCWMTQNLDFDIPTTALSSTTTDLTSFDVGGYTAANGYSKDESTGEITWTPIRGTIPSTALTNEAVTNSSDWVNDYYTPYSADVGDWYYNGDPDSTTCVYLKADTECDNFATTPFVSTGTHGHVGNYYNWSAAVAANNTNITPWTSATYNNIDNSPKNSICPAGWRLAHASSESETVPGSTAEFARLKYLYNGTPDASVKDKNLLKAPLYLARAGYFYSGKLANSGLSGMLWSSTVSSSTYARYWYFRASAVNPAYNFNRYYGSSLRCVAR